MIITEKSELILFFNFFMLERGSSKLASSKQRCYQPSDFLPAAVLLVANICIQWINKIDHGSPKKAEICCSQN